jgi:site-specific DNA recombinase
MPLRAKQPKVTKTEKVSSPIRTPSRYSREVGHPPPAHRGGGIQDLVYALPSIAYSHDVADRERYEVLEEVSDPGQSGASLERPGMDRVRDLVAAGGVSVVLAQDRDRFAREPAYLYLLREEFGEQGASLMALNQQGGYSPEGELTDGILDQLAKYERAKTAERTRRGKLKRAREGKVVPTHTPDYGFRYTEDREGYEVDPEKMAVVRRIFEMVGREGKTLHGTKKILDREGIPTPARARYWGNRFIRNLIMDDAYKPHTYEEVRQLVAPEVAARLGRGKLYGIWYYNVTRRKTRQVAELAADGSRTYTKRSRTSVRPAHDWIAVPVADSGIPRELVDAAREAIKHNRRSPSKKRRYWELAGGITRCGGCDKVMFTNSITAKNLHYYRCPSRRDNGKEACNVKNRRADEIEAEVWESIRAILSDPERLREDLSRMIEMKRNAHRGNPRREMDVWLEKLAEADRKRAKFQHAYAEDAITLDDLKARLAELEELRQLAQRELEVLRCQEEEIAQLEQDRDTILESYAGASEEALDSLTPEQRHNLYKSFRLEVFAHADGSTEIVLGDLLSYEEVCTKESLSRSQACITSPTACRWRAA